MKDHTGALHQAVYKGEFKTVSRLLKQGADWREADKNKQNEAIGKSKYLPSMNALEVAVVGNHLEIVAIILKQAIPGKDDALVQKACNLVCRFNFMRILKEFYKQHALFVKNEFLNALKENNTNLLFKMAKDVLVGEFDTIKDEQGNHILHLIAKKGSKEDLAEVLKLKPSVARLINLPNSEGNTPLHIAAGSDNRDVIIALTDSGALVGKPNLQGDTSVHIAAAHSCSGMIEQLCKAGYLQNRESQTHQVTFDILAKNKKNQIAKNLARWSFIAQTLEEQAAYRTIQKGVELIYQGRKTDLKKFISENPGIMSSTDDQGDTLLHHAVTAYKETGKSCLLEVLNAKPNVNIKNKNGLTPLLLAATLGVWTFENEQNRSFTIVRLKELGANLSEVDSNGFTALHHAALHDEYNSIYLLISSGVYVDQVTQSGLTPLHIAAFFGKKSAFDFLLRHQADINAVAYPSSLPQLIGQHVQTTQEITPLWLALNSNEPDIVNAIFDNYVAKKNTEKLTDLRTIDSSTLLHFFALTNDFKRFKQTLSLGVDPFITNNTNYLPFHSACATGALEIVKHYVEVLAPQQSYWNRLKGRTFDINDLPEKGTNALTLAGQNNDVIQYLKGKGAIAASATAERPQSKRERLFNFIGTQTEFRGQLESTRANQLLNLGRIAGSTILTAYKGSIGMGVAVAHQLLLYRMPTAIRNASALYYKVKPTVHNHAPRIVEVGLDEVVAITSKVTYGISTAVNFFDIAANPSRSAAGLVTSMGMANLASQCTDNLEIQGAAYFLGRELGMFGVEAYQSYEKPHSEDAMNTELTRAYDLWGSLLGKNVGEYVVSTMHQFTVMHQGLRDSIGWFEHTVLSYMGTKLAPIQSAVADVGLQLLDERIASALSMISLNSQACYSMIQSASREIQQLREQVLTNIEHKIVENLLPYSEHRDVTLKYLLLNQTVLLTQNLIDKKNDKAVQENRVKALEEERDILKTSAVEERACLEKQIEKAKNNLLLTNQKCEALSKKIEQSQSAYDTVWKKTPKGALEFARREAQQNQFSEKIKIESLKLHIQFLKDNNADEALVIQANSELQDSEKALVNLQVALESTEVDWLKLANPIEREQFPKHKEELGKHIDEQLTDFKQEQSKVYEYQSKLLSEQNKLNEVLVDYKNVEQKILSAKNDFDVIDLQIKAIDNPPSFNCRNIVENAFSQYPNDPKQAVKLIIDNIVATGMISFADANQRMSSSLIQCFKSHKHKTDKLNEVLTHHVLELGVGYRNSLARQRVERQKQIDAAIVEFKEVFNKFDVQNSLVQQNKLALEALIGQSVDAHMIEQLYSHPNNWDSLYNRQEIRTTLTLVGQSQMTVNSMIDGGGPSSQGHKAASLAKSLVDYKYLFITAPSIDVRLQEIDALTADLIKQTLDPSHIAVLKQNMDSTIAAQLIKNTTSLAPQLRASSISNQLQHGFRYNEVQSFVFESEGTSLSKTLAAGFEAKDDTIAKQAIVNALQDQTTTISIAEAGVYTTPVLMPHVPRKEHGLKRWWHHTKEEVKHYGKKILKMTGGVSASLDPNGVSAGFTYGNQFRVMQFAKPSIEPVFIIPDRTRPAVNIGTQVRVGVSEPAPVKSSVPYTERVIKDIPHVVVMPWESESKLKAQPLMFSPEAKAATQPQMKVARPLKRVQVPVSRPQAFQWEAAPQPWLPVKFPVPQNGAFTLRDFTKISASKEINVESSVFKTVVDNTRSAIAFLSDPAKRAEMQRDLANSPSAYAAYLGVCEVEQVNLRLAVFHAVKGFFDEVGGYIGADLYRATHDEETVTAQRAKDIGQAVVATTAYLSDKQNRIYLGSSAVSHVRDEVGRFVNGEPTRTGTAFEGWLNEQGQRPAEELVTGGIKQLVYLVSGEAFLRGVGYSSAQAYRLLKENPVNMQFFKEYGLKGPLFEPWKLYSGLPIDNLLLFNKSVLDNTTSKILDGQFYPKDKLTSLVNYLERRGVNVYGIPSDKDPYFIAFPNGASPQIFWPATPTVLQVKHELSHYLDYKKLGFDAYAQLSRYDREQLVLDRLQCNRLWSGLNDIEKQFSIDYVARLKTQKKVKANDK